MLFNKRKYQLSVLAIYASSPYFKGEQHCSALHLPDSVYCNFTCSGSIYTSSSACSTEYHWLKIAAAKELW